MSFPLSEDPGLLCCGRGRGVHACVCMTIANTNMECAFVYLQGTAVLVQKKFSKWWVVVIILSVVCHGRILEMPPINHSVKYEITKNDNL